jgi:hypothetical protein
MEAACQNGQDGGLAVNIKMLFADGQICTSHYPSFLQFRQKNYTDIRAVSSGVVLVHK